MKKQQLFILIFGIAIAFACKKQHRYPEDPKSTFDPPKTRLSGNWKLDDFTLNGTSIVNDLNNIPNAPINIRDVTLNYFFNSDDKNDKHWAFRVYNFSTRNNFDDVSITIGPYNSTQNQIIDKWFITPFKFTGTPAVANWVVTKLYKSDLHLVLQTDTGEFKMFFKKTSK